MDNKYKLFVTLCVISILFLSMGQPVNSSAADSTRTAPVKWTFMIYLDGDNDLERFVTKDIEQDLSLIGSNKDINVVVLADRIPGYSKLAGDWTTTKYFYVKKGMKATPENAIADWGERNMGDPQTLVDFLQYSKTNYPAEHYALVMWDHGWAWRPGQTMWDETDQDALDPDEIVSAMQSAGPVDIVAYDACEQQVIEIEATWRGYAQAIVASQEDVGWLGFTYNLILSRLQENPNMTVDEVAILMGRSMINSTVASVSLNASWDKLITAVDEWSLSLLGGLPLFRTEYDLAWKDTQHVADQFNKDLYDAAAEIQAHVPDATIQAKSQAVMDAFTDAVILFERHSPGYPDAHGIGIYWPHEIDQLINSRSTPEREFQYYQDHLVFSKLTHWDEFVRAYLYP